MMRTLLLLPVVFAIILSVTKGNEASWERIELSKREVHTFQRTFYKVTQIRIKRYVIKQLKQGRFISFSKWIKRKGFTFSQSKISEITAELKKRGCKEQAMTKITEWFTETKGEGGAPEKSWQTCQLSRFDVRQFKRYCSRKITKDVTDQMESGNFMAFSKWCSEKGAYVTRENMNKIVERMKKTKSIEESIRKCQQWFEDTDGKGGDGYREEYEVCEMNPREVDDFAQIFKKVCNKEISKETVESMKEGSFSSFTSFCKEENIKITRIQITEIINECKKVGITERQTKKMEEWYTSEMVDESEETFTRTEVTEITRIIKQVTNKEITEEVKKEIEEGSTQGLTNWMRKESITSAQCKEIVEKTKSVVSEEKTKIIEETCEESQEVGTPEELEEQGTSENEEAVMEIKMTRKESKDVTQIFEKTVTNINKQTLSSISQGDFEKVTESMNVYKTTISNSKMTEIISECQRNKSDL